MPHQWPQQKQLKMADLEAHSAMPVPTESKSTPQPGGCRSSQVFHVPLPEQGVLHSAVQCTEARMEGVNDYTRSLSPLARMRQRLDTGLCPQQLYFQLNQILTARQMETLCWDDRDEYIYRKTYEVDSRKYERYHDDLKVFGNNAEEPLLQVITTCTMTLPPICQTHRYHKCSGPDQLNLTNGKC